MARSLDCSLSSARACRCTCSSRRKAACRPQLAQRPHSSTCTRTGGESGGVSERRRRRQEQWQQRAAVAEWRLTAGWQSLRGQQRRAQASRERGAARTHLGVAPLPPPLACRCLAGRVDAAACCLAVRATKGDPIERVHNQRDRMAAGELPVTAKQVRVCACASARQEGMGRHLAPAGRRRPPRRAGGAARCGRSPPWPQDRLSEAAATLTQQQNLVQLVSD